MKITTGLTLMGLLAVLLIASCSGGNPKVNQFLDEMDSFANELVQAAENNDMTKANELAIKIVSYFGELQEIAAEGIEITPAQEQRLEEIGQKIKGLVPGL